MMRIWLLSFCMITTALLKAETKVLAFAGSTRDGSVNKKLVQQAANIARQLGADVTYIDLKDYPLPFFNEDEEKKSGMPEQAKQIRSLMLQSKAIIIASPEYNGSLSALLKNVIDWASRSEDAYFSRDAFLNKKFVLLSASPGPNGGTLGLVHLKGIIEVLGGKVVPKQVSVADAFTAFNEEGNLKDSKIEETLKAAVKQAVE